MHIGYSLDRLNSIYSINKKILQVEIYYIETIQRLVLQPQRAESELNFALQSPRTNSRLQLSLP